MLLRWRSGKAAACHQRLLGSIPVVAQAWKVMDLSWLLRSFLFSKNCFTFWGPIRGSKFNFLQKQLLNYQRGRKMHHLIPYDDVVDKAISCHRKLPGSTPRVARKLNHIRFEYMTQIILQLPVFCSLNRKCVFAGRGGWCPPISFDS